MQRKIVTNMNLQQLKQRLSLQNVWQSLQRVVLRFPVAVGLMAGLTILLSYMVIAEPTNGKTIVPCLMVFLSVGTPISLAASLWGEEQPRKRMRWLMEGAALALWGAYSVLLFYTDIFADKNLPAFQIGNAAWLTAIFLFALLGSFMREKEDLKAWHFICSSVGALLISGIVSWLMIGGVEGLVAGTGALFDFEPSKKLMYVLMIIGAVMLFGMLFCALLPQGERKHNDSNETPALLKKIVSWLLLPLLGCYILVLYAYGISILVRWELPKGLLSVLVSCVMIGYVLCYFLLYPEVTKRDTWQSQVLTRWLPIIILPLLVLMTVGIVRRVMDYGITAPRLYVLTMLLWFYAICIVMLVAKRKRFHWIVWSFAVLFVITSGQPLNYYRISRPILTAKIDKIVAEKGLQTPLYLYGLTTGSTLTDDEANSLRDDLIYMRKNYGDEYAYRWIEKEHDYTAEITTTNWKINYYHSNDFVCPQGYSTFRRFNRMSAYALDTVPERAIRDGILPVYHEDDIVLLFDTAAIRQADLQSTPLVIPSADQKCAYVPNTITVTSHSDSTIHLDYSGFLFSKDK